MSPSSSEGLSIGRVSCPPRLSIGGSCKTSLRAAANVSELQGFLFHSMYARQVCSWFCLGQRLARPRFQLALRTRLPAPGGFRLVLG